MKYLLILLTIFIVSCSEHYRVVAVISNLAVGCDNKQRVGIYTIRAVNQNTGVAYTTNGIIACNLEELTRVCSDDGITFRVCEEQ